MVGRPVGGRPGRLRTPEGEIVELLRLAAQEKADFWPTGAVMVVVLTLLSVGIGIWRLRNEKKGIGGPGK